MSATVAEVRAVLSADASSMVRGLNQAKSATRELRDDVARTNAALQTVRGATEGAGAAMRGVSGAADRASAGLREVGNSARQAEAQTRSFNNAASESRGHLGAMTSMLGVTAVAVTGLFSAMAGYKIFNFAKDAIFGFNSTLQGAQMQMGRMLKSEEKATAFISDLKQFAIQTPFQFEDLIKASQQFLVYGWKVEDIIPDMEAIGSAAMGDAYKIDMITRALGQMRAKGKVSSEEISMQLGESGIPGWRYVAEAFGVTIPEAMKLAEKGALDVETAIQAILGGMRRDFGGGMEAASKTFQGAMSNVKDAAQQALATGFKPLFDAVSGGLLKLATLMMGDRFQNAIKAMTGIAARFAKPLTKFFDDVIKKLETLDPMKAVAGFERLTGSLTGLKAAAGPLLGVLAGLKMAGVAGGFLGFLSGAILASEDGRRAMKELAIAMAEVARVIGPDLAQALSRMTPALVAVSQVISNLVVAFSKLPEPLQEFILLGGIAAGILSKFRLPIASIVGMMNPFAAGLRATGTEAAAAATQLHRYELAAAAAAAAGTTPGFFQAGGRLSQIGAAAGKGAVIGGIASTGIAMAGGGQGAQLGSFAGGLAGSVIGSFFGPGPGTVIGGVLGSAVGGGLGLLWDKYNSGADEAIKKTKEFKDEWATMVAQMSSSQLPTFRTNFAESGFQQAQNQSIDAIMRQADKFPQFQRRLNEMGISYLEFVDALSDRGSLATGDDIRAVADQLQISQQSLRYLLNFIPALRPFVSRLTNDFVALALAEGNASEIAAAHALNLGLVEKRLKTLGERRTLPQEQRGATPGIPDRNLFASDQDWGKKMGVDYEALQKATRAFAGEAMIAAKDQYRVNGSIREALEVTGAYREELANRLMFQLGLSRDKAYALAEALVKIPTEKIIEIQFGRKDYFAVANVAVDSYRKKLEDLEAWFSAQGLEVPPALREEAWNAIDPYVDRLIEKLVKHNKIAGDSVYQLEVLKYMYPEMAEAAKAKIDELIAAQEKEGLTGLHALERMKTAHADLIPQIQEVENRIIASTLAHSGSKKEMLANIEELRTKFAGRGDDSLVSALDRLKTIIEGLDGKKINITAILRALKEPSWDDSVTRFIAGVNSAQMVPVYRDANGDPFYDVYGERAAGGPVRANMPYLVGEKGPELFMPNKSGTIIPNDQLNKMRSNPSISAPPFSGMTPVGTTPWDNGGQAGPTGANKYVHIENLNVTNSHPDEAANAIVRRLRTEAFLAGN